MKVCALIVLTEKQQIGKKNLLIEYRCRKIY